MRDLPPQGTFDDIFLPRLIAGLHLHEFEGTLRLTLGEVVKILYFKRGEIASAASNADPDRLANLLIEEGRLTAEQLELARARMQPGSSLGKTLIEMGFLTPTELLQGARRQVQVIVSSCFSARSGGYEMMPGPLPAEVTSLGVNTRRLLFDCLMQSGDRAAVIREVGSMEAVYRPTDRLNHVLASLKLDSETDRIARILNGGSTLRDLSGRTSHDDFTVSRVVLALELLGGAEKVIPADESAPTTAPAHPIPIAIEEQDEGPPPGPLRGERGGTVTIPDAVDRAEAPGLAMPVGVAREALAPAAAHAAGETVAVATLPVAEEPPAIPQEELPAFTLPPDPAAEAAPPATNDGGEPHWEVDPQTGERVHVGPIEMTFDGRITQAPAESRGVLWILLGAGAVTLVVAGALGYVILRRGDQAPRGPTRPVASLPAAGGSGPSAASAPAGVTEKAREPGPPQAGERAVATVAPAGGGPAAPAEAAPSPSGRVTAATAREHSSIPAPAPPVGSRAPAASPIADARFASALSQIDAGDTAGAARQFESWIPAENTGRFTLQVMIACEEDTVKTARSRSGADAALFILPYSLKGRSCYRICWGVYPDAESARRSASGVPAALTGQSVPLVVPVSRLHSAG